MGRHSFFEWTNWTFGLVAVAYVVFSELREARRKRQLRALALEVEPSQAPEQPHLLEVTRRDRPRQDVVSDDRIRSILIQLGVDNQPFSLAVERAHRFGISRNAVEDTARRLRHAKLLRFGEPLEDKTRIRLN